MAGISWEIYLAALGAMNPDNYISFEGIEESTPEDDGFIDMTAYSPANPEQLILYRERWLSLRQETRELINIILDCPAEIREGILGTRKRSAARRLMKGTKIAKWLSRLWGDEELVNETIGEIRQFIQDGVRS